MTDLPNPFGDWAGVGHVANKFLNSVDAFMGEVRRERAVELSFESHRFNDLRRWLLLIESPYKLKTSIEFDRAGALNTSSSTYDPTQKYRAAIQLAA
jgi:starch-binding outer membrane protein, SusD/RagB family